MGILSRIFGGEKAIDSAVGAVGRAFDALHYSSEEKAEVRVKLGNMVVDWINNSKGQNLARRVIAMAIVGVWLWMYLLAGFFTFLAIVLAGWPVRKIQMEMCQSQAMVLFEMSNGLAGYVMIIVGFYFAAPHLGQIVTPALASIKEGMKGNKEIEKILNKR